MGQTLGKALPFATILALLTALGFTIPLIHNIEYGPFTIDLDIDDLDIINEGLYNFTLKVKVTNDNDSEIKIIHGQIGIYYDAKKYDLISQYLIDDLILPAHEATIYYVDSYVALHNDEVPRKVFVTITGQYAIGASLADLDYEEWFDLSPYWP